MRESRLGNILHNVVSGAGGLVHAGWHGVQHAINANSGSDEEGFIRKAGPARLNLTPERPPPIEEAPETLANHGDAVSQDWRWLALRCEQRLNAVLQQRTTKSAKLTDTLGPSFDIRQFACFMPRTVLEAIADRRIRHSDDFDIQIEQFTAAVVFCDASGFTALTEALDTKPNGAERLGNIINQFFDKIIKIVHYWGGDVIKFSGDAMTIVWPVDDESPQLDADGSEKDGKAAREEETGDDFYRIDSQVACQLAVQCCLTLHQTLHGYVTGCDDKVLTLHIGVGFGQVHILQVGGIMDRWEYVVAGAPLEEISVAEPLAGSGETVVSPSVASALAGAADLEEVPNSPPGRIFYKVKGLHAAGPEKAKSIAVGLSRSSTRALWGSEKPREQIEEVETLPVQPPPPLAPIDVESDDIDLLRRYIPPSVFRRLTTGCNVFLNELRVVSVVFICVRGLDVSTRTGSLIAHKLMKMTQKAAYTMEGSVNKFLVDDKGVLLLVMFGLPPVYHLDDPIRAIMAALRVIDGMKVFGLDAGIGITSGRVWCGTVGNEIRKEYTALGDYVNLAARLMAKAGPREIFVDVNTFQAARHALEFKQLPSMHVKGKEHPVQVFMPTGVMINQKKDAVEDHPLLSWPQWSGKKQLREMMLPSAPYLEQSSLLGKSSKYNAFRPPLDYPVPTGPLFAHEWCEPFLPELQPFAAVGGVMVIRGKEGLGTHELAKLLGQIGRKDLKRQTFFISNMPDSVQMNIGNVPLLAWRKLCTEMVERWRVSDNREKKGYSKIDRDNSVYGLTKELIHPSFHWRLEDMKPVIHGLVLPYELPENQVMLKQRLKNLKSYQRRHGGMRHPLIMSPAFNLLLKPAEWVGDAAAAAASAARVITPVNNWMRKLSSSQDDEVSDSDDSDDSGTGPPRLGLANVARGSGESIAPIIASLVNGFTLYESSIIILHVRTGTSVFAEMDRDSWKVARMVARVSLVRRSHRLENDMKDLKEWRRLHSRKCWWCKGYRTRTVVDSSGKEHLVQPTSLCRPLPSQFYQPLLFVLICSETTDNVPEQQQLVQMARDNNALIELKKLGLQETAAYLSHCLSIRKSGLDPGFVEYVQRASAGVPKYVYLTAKKLVTEQAVVLTPEGGVKKEARLSPRARRALGRRRSISAAGPEEDRNEGDEGDRDDDDSQDEEDERREDDEVARCVCELIEKVQLQRDELAKAQLSANSQRGQTDEAKLLPAPNDRWTHSAIYDRLPPDVRAPDAAALALDAPPLSAFDLGAMEEKMMQRGHRYDGSALDVAAGASGSDLCPSQLYLASKYRERLHAGLSSDPSLSADQTDSNASGAMGAKSRVERQSEPGGESSEGGALPGQRGSWPHHVHFDSGKETHAGQAGGGIRRKMGVAERQRLDDDARISRGKLTRAEYAFLQNAPPWVHLDAIDVKGLSLYKRRRWAAARNLEWDSDAECAVEATADATLEGHPAFLLQEGENGERRRRRTLYTGMVVKEDLLSLPFVPELIANCMFTVERLQPEEQMVAKVASVFPCAFTPVELCRAYPRRKPLEEFCAIIYQLIIRDVLEVCDPPSLEDLTSLAASIGVGGEGTEADMALDDAKLRAPGAAASKRAVRLSQSCLHNRSKRLSFLLNAASSSGGAGDPGEGAKAGNTLSPLFPGAGAPAPQNRGSSGFSSASLLPPAARGGGTPSPSDQNSSPAGNSKTAGTHSGSLEHVPFPGLAPGHERRPSVMKAGGLVTPRRIVEGSLGGERAQPNGDGAPGAPCGPRDPQPSGRLTMAKAGTVVTREVWETILMNEDGTDVFLRFNSIALQRVVSDLLLTDERKWLTLVCRRIIALRFTEAPSSSKPSEPRAPADAAAAGVRLSSSQKGVSEKGVSAPASPVHLEENRVDEGAEEEVEERDEAIEAELAKEQPPPQSLLETALAAERETHEQAVKAEQAIAAKEQKDEIERLVSKAVLSRAGSGHLAGRKLSRKETATPFGSPIDRHSSASSRGAMSSEESEPVIHVAADEERGGRELWQRVSEESHLGSVTNGRPSDPAAEC